MLKHDNISQKRVPFLEAHLFSAFLFYCFAHSRPVRSLQRTCVHGNILVSSCTLACKNRHDVILVQGSLDEILLHFTFSAIWVYNRSRAVSGLLYFEHRQNLLLCFDRGQTCLWVHVHKTSFFFLSETWHCYYVSKRVKCGPSHVTRISLIWTMLGFSCEIKKENRNDSGANSETNFHEYLTGCIVCLTSL